MSRITYTDYHARGFYLTWYVVLLGSDAYFYEYEVAESIWDHLNTQTTDDWCVCTRLDVCLSTYISFKNKHDALVFKLAYG